MKNFNSILAVVFIFLATSCQKDFLSGQPFSTTTTDNFYKTPEDIEQALVGCYAILNAGGHGGFYNQQFPTLGTAGTDEMVTDESKMKANFSPIGLAAWNSQTGFITEVWSYLYIGINRCNTLLEKIENVDLDSERKAQIIAEARFLRGLEYLYLGMMYGGVPVVTVSNPDLNLPRNSTEEVFGQSFADLEFAYNNLNPTPSMLGRATKYAAAGLLAKAYEFAASCKNNNVNKDLNFPLNDFDWANSEDLYQKALVLTTDIINSGQYKLIDNYDYLFRETTKSSQYQEFVFNTESSSDPANGNQPSYQSTLIPRGNNSKYGGGTCRILPTGELFAKYSPEVIGDVYLDFRKSWNFSDKIKGHVYEVVEGVGYYVPDKLKIPKPNQSPSKTVASKIFYGSKFRYRDPKLKNFSTHNTDDNFPILRYAEVLLLHAEAIHFTSGNDDEARSFLSQIRRRAISPTLTSMADRDTALQELNAAYTKTDFVEELLDERARELCYEGSRHFDLTRFGKYVETIDGLTTDRSLGFNNTAVTAVQLNFTPNKIWFPIPFDQLLIQSALEQNPGY
jgi:hypothetical protein